MIIYQALNKVNEKVYVGMTTKSLDRRIHEHFLSKNKGYFQLALGKYGLDSFEFTVLDKAESRKDLGQKEIFWIDQLNCVYPNGYNLTGGGDGLVNPSLAARKKMSESRKDTKPSDTTRAKMSLSQRGRKHSEETKIKMSIVQKGLNKTWSEEDRKRIGDIQKGKKRGPMPDEVRRKISDSHKGKTGKPLSDKIKAALSLAWKGEKNPNYGGISEEHRMRLSESHKGKKQSDETRKKRSESLKAAYANGSRKSWNLGKGSVKPLPGQNDQISWGGVTRGATP
jgi:group I intron endonuclease